MKIKFASYGNTELWIDEGRTLTDSSTRTSLTNSSTTISLRKGQSYLIDYWVYKPTGSSAAKLYWNLDSSGNATGTDVIIPNSVLYTASQDVIEIAPTEGTTDYTINSVSSDTNNRAVKITFSRAINAGNIQYITLETS